MTLAPLAFGVLMDAGHYRASLGIALMLALLIATAVNVRRNAPARWRRRPPGHCPR